MRRVRSSLCGLGVVALVACAHAPPPVEEGPFAAGGRSWHELASPHLVLRTDLPLDAARGLIDDLERTARAFDDVALQGSDAARAADPVELVLLADEPQFAALAPDGAAAFFLAHQPGADDEPPMIAMPATSLDGIVRRFQHELVHRVLDRRLPHAPAWLAEGMAQYYSTLRVVDGEVILGELPLDRLFVTDVRSDGSLVGRRVETRVSLADVPSAGELAAADYADFSDGDRGLAYYAGAWALVHLCANGPAQYRDRFARYLADLGAGVSSEQAWTHGFGDLPRGQLDRDLRGWEERAHLPVRRAPYHDETPPAVAHVRVRMLSPAEVAIERARLRPWDSREAIVAAGHDLARAARTDPDGAETLYWMSLYHRRWRRFAAAEAELDEAIAEQPAESRYAYALAALLDEWSRADEPDPDVGSRRTVAIARLAELAHRPAEYQLLARDALAHGRLTDAADYARRAGSACWDCRNTLATVERALGRKAPRTPIEPPLAYAMLPLIEDDPGVHEGPLPPIWERWWMMGVGGGVPETFTVGRTFRR